MSPKPALLLVNNTSGRMMVLSFNNLDEAEDAYDSTVKNQPTVTVSRLYATPTGEV